MMREAGLHQEEDEDKVEEWMDQEEKANKEENLETEQEEMSKVSNPTAAAAPTKAYSHAE